MVNLRKGEKFDITKGTGYNTITGGMGWDANSYNPDETFDLDVAAFLLGASGKVTSDDDVIFFNHKVHPSGAVKYSGDNRTGDGNGDDETIEIDLSKVPENIEKIVFTASIYDAETKMQNFGMVNNAYIRIFDTATQEEICKYELDEDFSLETSVVAGELYRRNGEWKFNAIGQGMIGGMKELCQRYGVN